MDKIDQELWKTAQEIIYVATLGSAEPMSYYPDDGWESDIMNAVTFMDDVGWDSEENIDPRYIYNPEIMDEDPNEGAKKRFADFYRKAKPRIENYNAMKKINAELEDFDAREVLDAACEIHERAQELVKAGHDPAEALFFCQTGRWPTDEDDW
jgi:hypothetical protein